METGHNCPACGRQFEKIFDYPLEKILSLERLPVPEAVVRVEKVFVLLF